MLHTLTLPHGTLPLPAFLPDATQGVVRAVDAQDLLACGIQAVQMNVFHLMQRPGSSTIQALGGLHRMAGWHGRFSPIPAAFKSIHFCAKIRKAARSTTKGPRFARRRRPQV
jgi:queuine tRNA-ribosyltransferase